MRREMNSRVAISGLVSPLPTSATTSDSIGVSESQPNVATSATRSPFAHAEPAKCRVDTADVSRCADLGVNRGGLGEQGDGLFPSVAFEQDTRRVLAACREVESERGPPIVLDSVDEEGGVPLDESTTPHRCADCTFGWRAASSFLEIVECGKGYVLAPYVECQLHEQDTPPRVADQVSQVSGGLPTRGSEAERVVMASQHAQVLGAGHQKPISPEPP